mgnify:FL=1
MNIRNEKRADIEPIANVTIAAFKTCPYSRQTEQFIIDALRNAGGLSVSLVAEIDGTIVGHIAFSPITIDGRSCGWYGLGPLSVLPAHQKQGIGKALMQEGISKLKSLGAAGCALVGDPNYYRQFGFKNTPGLILEGVPKENFLALSFNDPDARGTVIFHEAFTADH